MSRRNMYLDAILVEIERNGGVIDEVDDKRRHLMVYWSCAGRKLIQVAPRTSRSASGLRNAISEIRRHAKGLRPCPT
jgi:hypothetical protein